MPATHVTPVLAFPLISVLTEVLKTKAAPNLPRWIWPLFNVAIGVGLAAGADALGIDDPAGLGHSLAELMTEGAASGGAATVAYDVANKAKNP